MKVLLAVEVGSRMWGLESPDSDHDIRFIFASEDLSEYLAVFPRRDTIEVNEAGGKADVCGWDVRKPSISATVRTRRLSSGSVRPRPWFSTQSSSDPSAQSR